jgi:hypothetical protein
MKSLHKKHFEPQTLALPGTCVPARASVRFRQGKWSAKVAKFRNFSCFVSFAVKPFRLARVRSRI